MTTATLSFVTAITMVGPLLLDLSRELGVALGQAGLLAAAMSLPWALGAPFTGLLSDRLGRKPLIVLALAGIGVSTIGAAFATNFATLLVARFAAGLFGAFGPASVMAAVGDLYPPQRRGMAMGWLNAGFGLAAVAGVPAVGIIDGLFGWRWAFAATGAVLLVLAGLFHAGFPSVKPGHAGSSLRQTYAAVLGTPFGLVNASSRPAFLALGSELSPRYRGALLGLLSLTNQGGSVLGSSLGGLAIALGSYGTLAILALCGGVGAAVLAIPLARLKLAREA